MKRIVKIVFVLLFVLLLGYSVYSYMLQHKNNPIASRRKTINDMDTVEVFFRQNIEIFEMIAPIMAERHFVSVDYSGVTYQFIQDKMEVHVPEYMMLSEQEIAILIKLFDGYDNRQLEMLRISSNGHETEFFIYIDGQYEILIIKNPNSRCTPKVMYRAFGIRRLTEEWIMLAIDNKMSAEESIAIYNTPNEITEALNISMP